MLLKLLKCFICFTGIAGGVVNHNIIVAAATGIVQYHNRAMLKEYGGTLSFDKPFTRSVMERMGYVKRKGTKAAKKLPPDFDEVKTSFIERVRNEVQDNAIPADLIIAFDQTGLRIVPHSNWTMEEKGAKQCSIVGLDDKREVTAVLGISLSGDLLPLQVIYAGKTNLCHPDFNFPDEWDITHTTNHWSNSESMVRYGEKVLIPYITRVREKIDYPEEQPALAIFDVFKAHQDEKFLDLLRNHNIHVVFVPPSCTGELQPGDQLLNAQFKSMMKESFTAYYAAEMKKQLDRGISAEKISAIDLRLSTMKPLHAHWMLESFHKIKLRKEMIIKNFDMCGIKKMYDAL